MVAESPDEPAKIRDEEFANTSSEPFGPPNTVSDPVEPTTVLAEPGEPMNSFVFPVPMK